MYKSVASILFFPFNIKPKGTDPCSKTDLDLWLFLEAKPPVLQPKNMVQILIMRYLQCTIPIKTQCQVQKYLITGCKILCHVRGKTLGHGQNTWKFYSIRQGYNLSLNMSFDSESRKICLEILFYSFIQICLSRIKNLSVHKRQLIYSPDNLKGLFYGTIKSLSILCLPGSEIP